MNSARRPAIITRLPGSGQIKRIKTYNKLIEIYHLSLRVSARALRIRANVREGAICEATGGGVRTAATAAAAPLDL